MEAEERAARLEEELDGASVAAAAAAAGDNDDSQLYADYGDLYESKRQRLAKRAYPRSWLKFVDKLGSGELGLVLKAETSEGGKRSTRYVAVKTLKDSPSQREIDDCLSEAALLTTFDHENVVSLLGVCIERQPWLIVLEYCPHGDLRNFLRLCVTCETLNMTFAEQIQMGLHIATGLDYLTRRSFVHRDVAARNCLVGHDSVIKIADSGLSRRLASSDDYYHVQTKGKLPVRWMAVESLEFRKFSSKSDVWSFGVVLWELMTFGTVKPFRGVQAHAIAEHLRNGRRLACPRGCPDEMYTLMKRCWHMDARHRPTFAALCDTLRCMLQNQLEHGATLRNVATELEELTSSLI
jgi:serine/threonine protein kinase